MFHALWFFIKVAFVSTGAIWLATRPGDVTINVMDYNITMQAGFFFIALAGFLFVSLFLLRFIRSVLFLPKTIATYRAADRRKKSFRALTRGLVAVAAGDAKKATYYSKHTQGLWPDINGLSLLLEAQAAKLRGEDGFAQNRYEHLLKDKEAAFLGVRGLLKTALDQDDFARALDFARQAEKQHPKKPWVIKCVYELEIKNRLWPDALRTNHKAEKFKVYEKDKIISDRVAIFLYQHDKALRAGDDKRALSEVEKAYKLDEGFVPSVTRYVNLLLKNNKTKKSAAIIEKAWKKNTHPDLADLWTRLAPSSKGKDVTKDMTRTMQWFEKLISFNPQCAEAYITAAHASMDMGHWGEAKAYLVTAEKLYPSARLYRLQAIVEQHSTQNDDSIHRLMERAADALPDKAWICQETGMIYDEWQAIAKPHGGFNTIRWDVPGARIIHKDNSILSATDPMAYLDPAA